MASDLFKTEKNLQIVTQTLMEWLKTIRHPITPAEPRLVMTIAAGLWKDPYFRQAPLLTQNKELITEFQKQIQAQRIPLNAPIKSKEADFKFPAPTVLTEKLDELDMNKLLTEREHETSRLVSTPQTHVETATQPLLTPPQHTSVRAPQPRPEEQIPVANIPGQEMPVQPQRIAPNEHSVIINDPPIAQIAKNQINNELFKSPDVVVIDSRMRDRVNYPNSNFYSIPLGMPFHNVYAIKLISAIVPRSQYNINSTNNTIWFRETAAEVSAGTYKIATIVTGMYDITSLITAIGVAMSAAGGLATYTISYSTTTRKVTFASNLGGGASVFELIWGTNNKYSSNTLAPVLGYIPSTLTGSSSYTGTMIYNLLGEQYAILKIDEAPLFSHSGMSHLDGALTEIPLQADTWEYSFYGSNNHPVSKIYNPIRNKLNTMTIRWYDYSGSLFDFNGLDHILKFEIYHLRTQNN